GLVSNRHLVNTRNASQESQPDIEVRAIASFMYARDLDQLVNGGERFPASDLVVQGRVIDTAAYRKVVSRSVTLPPKPGGPPTNLEDDFTDFTVRISEVVTMVGAQPPSQVIVMMPGAAKNGKGGTFEDLRLLEVGQEYILFLHR